MVDPEGPPFYMKIRIENLQKIANFANFDEDENQLVIMGKKLMNSDVGFYTILVKALVTNGIESQELSGKMRLSVLPAGTDNQAPSDFDHDKEDEIKDEDDNDYSIIDESDNTDDYNTLNETTNIRIAELSQTGILKITFDKESERRRLEA